MTRAPARRRGRVRRSADPALDRGHRARDPRARHRPARRLGPRARSRSSAAPRGLGAPRRARSYVVPEDVEALFGPVLGHRVLFTPAFLAARRGRTRRGAVVASSRPAASSARRGPAPDRAVATRSPSRSLPRRRVAGRTVRRHALARRAARHRSRGARPYRPGDDVRRIDWRASARLSSAARQRRASSCASTSPRRRPAIVVVDRPQPLDGALPGRASLAVEAARGRHEACRR